MKHLYVINPVAGGNRVDSAAVERKIKDFAERLGDPYEIYITKAPLDASEKVKQEAKAGGELYVYACGGDGTLNECVNGAALCENVAVTHFPCGTGNDFIKTFGKENVELFRDLNALANGIVRPLDLIDCNGRYSINICSVGVDARIGADVHKYSMIPIIGGNTGYIVSLVVNVIKGVRQNLRITTESESSVQDVSLICACNGRYYGGGFNPVPDALPDDGIIEFLVVSGVSRLKVAQIIGKYSKGRFRELEDVIKHIRGGYLEISDDKEFVVNIDGEAIRSKNISFKLVPQGINFIFPFA